MTAGAARGGMHDMDFLNQSVGPLTLGQWIGALVAFLVISSALSAMKRKSEQKEAAANTSEARCLGCGWQGRVSRYHRTCPKCGNSITRLARGES